MEIKRFRPHHILCMRYIKLRYPERGETYRRAEQQIIHTLQKEDNVLLEMKEGVDELCRACPNCRDNRCESPIGGDEGVRKWDHIILKELNIPYGEIRSSQQWRNLFEQEGPLQLCKTKCPNRLSCGIFPESRDASIKTSIPE